MSIQASLLHSLARNAFKGQVMTQNTTSAHRPRLAAVVTAYKRLLHGQHVVDRLLDGYGWAGTFHNPTIKIYPTIAESLTLGGSKLAVDGVVVVCEHGTHPLTETGIMKHPHFEF